MRLLEVVIILVPIKKYNVSTRTPDRKYYYIDHYYSKSTEEFISKLIKGDALRKDPRYIHKRIEKYFGQSEIIDMTLSPKVLKKKLI